jgi:hypothetical protein
MSLFNTKVEFIGSGKIKANVDTILFEDTFLADTLAVAEAGHADLDVRFTTDSILGALNELMDGLTDVSGSVGGIELFFTPASGIEFVMEHGLETDVWAWDMWSTDGTPIASIMPENVYPSGNNHVAVELDEAASGRLVLTVGGPGGVGAAAPISSGIATDYTEIVHDDAADDFTLTTSNANYAWTRVSIDTNPTLWSMDLPNNELTINVGGVYRFDIKVMISSSGVAPNTPYRGVVFLEQDDGGGFTFVSSSTLVGEVFFENGLGQDKFSSYESFSVQVNAGDVFRWRIRKSGTVAVVTDGPNGAVWRVCKIG